jgi:hypothetical protein
LLIKLPTDKDKEKRISELFSAQNFEDFVKRLRKAESQSCKDLQGKKYFVN